ncbi:MAG: signal peptidase II [Candidatus Omnitrophica bacterium]|nr:signal peptidase II [Candidatus Omnitrophota bacterium]
MPGKNGNGKQVISFAFVCIVASLIFTADLAIKRYFLYHHSYESIPVIKNILYLTVVFNKGAAFGILRGQTSLLIYTGIIFLLVFLFVIAKGQTKNKLFLVACGLIIGGALSNLADRIFLGFVVDYIDVKVWPVFNLSDSAISVGAFFLLLNEFRKPKI